MAKKWVRTLSEIHDMATLVNYAQAWINYQNRLDGYRNNKCYLPPDEYKEYLEYLEYKSQGLLKEVA